MIIRYTIYAIVIFAYIWWTINCIKDGIHHHKRDDKFTASEHFDAWCLVHVIALGYWAFVKFFTIYLG